MSALSTADRLAIHELLARSGWAYDEARLDVMQACFTDDAQMSVRIAGGDVIVISFRRVRQRGVRVEARLVFGGTGLIERRGRSLNRLLRFWLGNLIEQR